ncbi:type II secretion system F family protein [Pseudidiomarina mangrovi]|uniref:type II secretion system F family protein n=1 Tax=Pseudidiomarina mangrovi TaxID=2487133 RepID=UPI000FC9ADCC|nr:type II secretion system F family protein [Pseudidiomarina mangrovi]
MPNLTIVSLVILSLLVSVLVMQFISIITHWLAQGVLMQMTWQYLPARTQRWLEQHVQKILSELSPQQWLLQQLSKLILIVIVLLLPIPVALRLLVVLVLVMPELRSWQQRRDYRRQLVRQWPATLDVIAMTLHAGLSFRATLHTLSDSATVSVAFHELARMHAQQQAGFSLEEVLNEFATRIPHPTIALFRAAVLHAHKGGGALASTLEQQAQQARTMQLLAAEKSAQEAAVKLLLPLLVCFFPVTFLLILGPVILSFMQGETL